MKNKKVLYITTFVIIALVLSIAVKVGINLSSSNSNSENRANLSNEEIQKIDEKSIILEVSLDASYKTGDIEELYDDASIVLVAEYVGDKKTIIEKNNTPFTLSIFKIKKIFKNDTKVKIDDEIITKKTGGIITVQQLLDARGTDFAKKIGADGLSKTESKSKYVKFYTNNNLGDKSLDEHKTRLLFLNYDERDGNFIIIQDDYGMLSYDEFTNTAFDIDNQNYKKYSFLK